MCAIIISRGKRWPRFLVAAAAVFAIVAPAHAFDAADFPYAGVNVIHTDYAYATLVERLTSAVKKNRMGIVTRASATLGAKSLGKTIPGNMVVGVFRPDFAIRMLAASVPAGIEAPLRFYITEDPGGRSTLTYRSPSAVFGPYTVPELDVMARELDVIFDRIAADATAP